jgi:hypothetical protein
MAMFAAQEGVFVKTFCIDSWLDHMRQHQRVTNADRVLQDAVHRFQAEGTPAVGTRECKRMIGYGLLIAPDGPRLDEV